MVFTLQSPALWPVTGAEISMLAALPREACFPACWGTVQEEGPGGGVSPALEVAAELPV